MRLIDRLRPAPTLERAGLVQLTPTWQMKTPESSTEFRTLAAGAYQANGIVFACITARMQLFSEARLVWRRYRDGGLWSNAALDILENPWPNATATELLSRMLQDADIAGNAYVYKASDYRLQRLRPDKVEILHDGYQVSGYLYWPDGIGQGTGIGITPDEMAHWAPVPDPESNWKGMSRLRAVIPEIRADEQMLYHQERFYQQAATPNMLIKIEGRLNEESRNRLRAELERKYSGLENAYKTLVLDGGADAQVVGKDFQQLDFSVIQKGGETRIASALDVPPIVVGLKAGLDAATYSNYQQALKAFGHKIRPLWDSACAVLGGLIEVPGGSELWYDTSDIAALRDDAIEEANIQQTTASTIRTYMDAGFTPESSVAAAVNQDPNLLEHTGLFSVQLQPAGEQSPNGKTEMDEDALASV